MRSILRGWFIFIEYVTPLETQFTTNNAIFCFLIAYTRTFSICPSLMPMDPLFIHIDSRYMAEDVSLIGVETCSTGKYPLRIIVELRIFPAVLRKV